MDITMEIGSFFIGACIGWVLGRIIFGIYLDARRCKRGERSML